MSEKLTKNIGGDRLGSGAKMNVDMKTYSRSTHNLDYTWKSTMAPGVLVPFMKTLALPGDTFNISLGADARTHPTTGPLFGSFKLQLDVFTCPIRLYNAALHNNALGIGLNMSQIKLPQIEIASKNPDPESDTPIDIQQINPSSLLSYLGIKAVGQLKTLDGYHTGVQRKFNGIPYLAYFDIYKQYYANKQEEIGVIVDYEQDEEREIFSATGKFRDTPIGMPTIVEGIMHELDADRMLIGFPIAIKTTLEARPEFEIRSNFNLEETNTVMTAIDADGKTLELEQLFQRVTTERDANTGEWVTTYRTISLATDWQIGSIIQIIYPKVFEKEGVTTKTFRLQDIDDMRERILAAGKSEVIINGNPYEIDVYRRPLGNLPNGFPKASKPLEGLLCKTYQSDILNNWLNTEWIDGDNGINEITSVDVSDGKLNLNELDVARKVRDMLNRIALSGGTYNDWLETVYTHDVISRAETPVYQGGLSKEIVFEQVVSTVGTEADPLGTLGGQGRMSDKHKGGQMKIRIDEPSYIIGIVSITPRVDYSQGNDWDVNLKTVDDFHKPAMDGIGFQELLTELASGLDTKFNTETEEWEQNSIGKQPAWINYMTERDKAFGNFAIETNQMFMTLNRRYEYNEDMSIKDLTTYIDPGKFNYAFADTDITAQNFWVQIGCKVEARRKMSAKIIPNL